MVHFELFERTMSMSMTAAGASCVEPVAVWLNLSRYRYPWWPAKVSTFHLLHTLLHLLYHPFAPPYHLFARLQVSRMGGEVGYVSFGDEIRLGIAGLLSGWFLWQYNTETIVLFHSCTGTRTTQQHGNITVLK